MEISGKEVKFAQNGLFAVTASGIVYRKTKSGYIEAPQHKTSQGGRRKAVTATTNKKQKMYYVHRIVAEAWMPNPNDYPQINHIDGNPSNNHVSNIEWCTAKHNMQHAVRTGLIKTLRSSGKTCSDCGEKHFELSPTGICAKCLRQYSLMEGCETVRENKLLDQFEKVKTELLSERESEMLDMRLSGKTFREIENEFGVTRQRVEQILKRASQKTDPKYARHKPSFERKRGCQYEPKPNGERVFASSDVYPNLIGGIYKDHRSIKEFCTKHIFEYASVYRRISSGLDFPLQMAISISKVLNEPNIEHLFERNIDEQSRLTDAATEQATICI